MDNKKFYISTAIAYTSSKPHIGNVYEAILADSIARYKRKRGFDVYFQTGTDEHGQKIQLKAEEAKINPQAYVDNVCNQIKETYKLMNVSYDNFVRTTDKSHEEEVAKVFEKLLAKGDIYKGTYEGWYCVSCESFFTEKDLVDGCCPDCGEKVSKAKEEAYFLRLAPYQERLINHIKRHPEFIQPESRRNEMLNNFLKDPLPDLCVSRTSYTWGVKVTSDPKHVIYVWIDALLNYLTGLGYKVDEYSEGVDQYWPCDVHLIGKDILRFHTIYWPIILMALDMPLPKQVFGHPWILMNHGKMSKSKGNVIYADELVNLFGVDAVRYYVLHEIPFAQDGNITYELVTERYNSDLANIYGNLVSRTIAMCQKYFDSKINKVVLNDEFSRDVILTIEKTRLSYFTLMDKFKVSEASEAVINLLRRANKYIDETKPWVLAKDEASKHELEGVLYLLLETIRVSSILLENIMPQTSNEILKSLNVNSSDYSLLEFGIEEKYHLGESKLLFKRLDVNKDVLDIVLAKENKKEEKKEPKKEVTTKELISIDDFDKIDLCVGQILEAKKHPKADKLLVFKVDLGTEVRQIVSGIASYYEPEKLIGKKVCVVKNLKPIKLRGEDSFGMLLCASNDESLELLNVDKLNPGDIIS